MTSMHERPSPQSFPSKHVFSCASCYNRKVKCDRQNPCSYCSRRGIECLPSQSTGRPRKRRFAEAELLARLRKYESALISLGADLDAIKSSNDPGKPNQERSIESSTSSAHYNEDALTTAENSAPISIPADEFRDVFEILDGEEVADGNKVQHRGQKWFDRIFARNTTSPLFAVEAKDSPAHPAPFEMFKLWQIYCDNVHPLDKILHAPSFQRKMSSYGANLHLAPASDQALFFAVYVAALSSLTAESCRATLFTEKQPLLDEYISSTQIWLGRAGVWRTSELSVLQALVLFLCSVQNTVDPRSVSCFTAVADRIARRMGLNSHTSHHSNQLIEQEVGKRVWWQLILLDAKVVERVGLGTGAMAGNWSVHLPSQRSDAELESVSSLSLSQIPAQPSSEMIFFMMRAEGALFLAKHRSRESVLVGYNEPKINGNGLSKSKQDFDDFERYLASQYLAYCDVGLPHHQLTKIFAQMMMSRMRMSACLYEENRGGQASTTRAVARMELLKQCTINVEAFNKMRGDTSLEQRFLWFMKQNLPIFAYIQMLRLLQTLVTGDIVDRAWQAIEQLKGNGIKLIADSLTLKAWNARKAAAHHQIDDPLFIVECQLRATSDGLPNLHNYDTNSTSSSAPPSESDFMAMLAEIMSSEADVAFDW